MRVASIVGGRPNLIKAGAIHAKFSKARIQHHIIDIGVYQRKYGQKTYSELNLPKPSVILQESLTEDYLRNIKFLAHEINLAIDKINPDAMLIYGDLDPGVAASFSCSIKDIPICHIEAGLRNYELDDTEEINRIAIDKFSKLLFCTSKSAKDNLLNEGFGRKNIYVTGNTIITALRNHLKFANTSNLQKLGLKNKGYGILTIHREENLKSPGRLDNIFKGIEYVQQKTPLIFINYLSTIRALSKIGYNKFNSLVNTKTIETLSYHDYLGLLRNASFVITDSSGIQDETTYLGIPCITCRETSHRADTLVHGNNILVSDNSEKIIAEAEKALLRNIRIPSYPSEWDIDAGDSITKVLLDRLEVYDDRSSKQ